MNLTGLHSRLPPVLPHEREFFINRIWSGYTKYQHDGMTLRIQDPTKEIKYEAEEIYYKTYDRAINSGILTSDDMLSVLRNYGIWTPEDDDNWKNYPKDIDRLKIQMFKYAIRTNLVAGFRRTLSAVRGRYEDLRQKKNSFFQSSADGVANFAKWQYIIGRCTRHRNRKCDWSQISIHNVMNYYYNSRINDILLRYLAHNTPWTIITSSSEYLHGISDKSAVELTDEQIGLLSWTTMYGNVRKSHDSPADFIIDDDDMLDGWLLTKQKERQSQQIEQTQESLFSDKVGKHSEILLMASNKREAEDIYNMNDAKTEAVRQSRMKQLLKNQQMQDAQFNDVALDLKMKKTKMLSEKLKQTK